MTGADLRAVPWGVVVGGSAMGLTAQAVDNWVVPGGPGSALLWFALGGFAVAVAYVFDEPAAAVVDAAPLRRTAWIRRLTPALLPVTCWLAGAAVVALDPRISWRALAATGVGFLAVILAAAATLRHRGNATPGDVVAAASGAGVVLALAGGSVFGTRPALEAYDPWSGTVAAWCALALVALVMLARSGADPMSGRRRSG